MKHLNELEVYFDLKVTTISKLESIGMKFESLEEIWFIYKEQEQELLELQYVNIMKIEPLPIIKKYEGFLRKIEKYNKDPDYFKIAQHLLQKIPPFLNTVYLIEDLKNPIFREQDYEEITNLFEK